MRMMEMIANLRGSDCYTNVNKFSLSVPRGVYREEYGESAYWSTNINYDQFSHSLNNYAQG